MEAGQSNLLPGGRSIPRFLLPRHTQPGHHYLHHPVQLKTEKILFFWERLQSFKAVLPHRRWVVSPALV